MHTSKKLAEKSTRSIALALTGIAGLLGTFQANAGVTVRDHQLLRDDYPWVPHGVVQIAFVAPPAAAQGVFAQAYSHYSPNEYVAMRAHGIDSVRIQVSQPGLDPKNPLFTHEFRCHVIDAVRAARAAGLVVIVSVQDEAQSGETRVTHLPNDATRRVWASLAPEFSADRGILFELLNEPNLPATKENWQLWANAMNATIETVRHAGASNVVVADGLNYAERLKGAPALDDPLNQVVYASHPYAHNEDGQTKVSWDYKFGDFARSHPVIVTEWATVPNYFCNAKTPERAAAFLNYLHDRGIGLMAYSWDFAGSKFGSAFYGFPAQPTTFQNKQCGDIGFGPGNLVEQAYRGISPVGEISGAIDAGDETP